MISRQNKIRFRNEFSVRLPTRSELNLGTKDICIVLTPICPQRSSSMKAENGMRQVKSQNLGTVAIAALACTVTFCCNSSFAGGGDQRDVATEISAMDTLDDTALAPSGLPLPAEETPLIGLKLAGNPTISLNPLQFYRVINQPAKLLAEKTQANDEVSRGAAAAVYAKVAPAVVLIQSGTGFGSGFIVDEAGWIITNNHVVASAPIFLGNGARLVKITLGHLQDGVMTVDPTTQLAWVYKTEERRDLALLKLVKPSKGKLPTAVLAESVPTPGNDCVAIGHPKAGLLWTVRQGQITGVGQWPRDSTTALFGSLAASGSASTELHRAIENFPKRKVLLSSCGINPGDSGGPLLDEQGRVIAVTFGIPKNGSDPGVSLDKFAYHVHLDELKEFLADRPTRLRPYVPDPWPPALLSNLEDRVGDGVRDTLVFGMKLGEPLSGFQCDLAHKSSPRFVPTRLADPENRKLWQFQFAFAHAPATTAFYDTRNTGKIDLILTDFNRDGIADLELRLLDDEWKVVPTKGQKMFDASHFIDKSLAERFQQIMKHAAGRPKTADGSTTGPKSPAILGPKAPPAPAIPGP